MRIADSESTTLRWARSVDIVTLQAKIDEYTTRAKGMGDRDVHVLWSIVGDLKCVLADRLTSCVAP